MWRLSFRSKLLIAMMLVVAGVTGTTLYVTQHRVRATYQRLFQEQFNGHVQLFTHLQRTRLASVAERCRGLVESIRVKAAMEEGDAELLYKIGADELQEVLETQGPGPGATFFRFLDLQGQVIPTDDPRTGLRGAGARQRLDAQLRKLGTLMQSSQDQEIGFMAAETDDGQAVLQEMIVTKIAHADQTRGALILAFPVPEMMEAGAASSPAEAAAPALSVESTVNPGRIRLGLWVGETLYARSNDIPVAVRDTVSRRLQREIQRGSASANDDPPLILNGVAHRLYYRPLNAAAAFPAAYQACLYSLETEEAEQRSLRNRILLFGGVGLAGALAASFMLSHGLTVPIRDLTAGTEQIRQGNFDVTLPVRAGDDLGQLAVSFNEMAAGLAQREKYRRLLNMVADEKVATQMMTGSIRLGGERRVASVLFCDIRGFTALTENMPPEEVIEMLNEHMTALAQLVKAHDGVVDKFVGDLIMAIFGAPLVGVDPARAAAACALKMIEERLKLDARSRYKISIGIGIATGEMVAGCMGSMDRLNYTVLGPRVNLASRLCSHAKADQVVIDDNTRLHLGDLAHVEPLPPLALKGFTEPVAAFALRNVRPAPNRA